MRTKEEKKVNSHPINLVGLNNVNILDIENKKLDND
jgi:hypothetical protein